MTGQGSPNLARRISRAMVEIICAAKIPLLIVACISACAACCAQEHPIEELDSSQRATFRFTWGGGTQRTWQVAIDAGSSPIRLVRTLGIDPHTPGSVYPDDSKIHSSSKSACSFGGFDFEVPADPDLSLSVTFFTNELAGFRYQQTISVSDLLTQSQGDQLDDTGNRYSIGRAPGDQLHVEFARDSLVFNTGDTFTFDVIPRVGMNVGSNMKLHVQLVETRTNELQWDNEFNANVAQDGQIQPFSQIQIPLPDREGAYRVDLRLQNRNLRNWNQNLISRSVELAVADTSAQPALASNVFWSELASLDPAKQHSNKGDLRQRIAQLSGFRKNTLDGNARCRTVGFENRNLLQIDPGGWNTIEIPVDQIGKPHIVEVEYLHDRPMRLGISFLQPDAAGQISHFGSDSGVSVPQSTLLPGPLNVPEIRTHRMVVWPKHKQPLLLLANRDDRESVKIGAIRVFSGPDKLAPASATQWPENKRKYIAYLEKPLFLQQFDATRQIDLASNQLIEDWQTCLEATERLIQHLKANGYTGLALTVVSDGASLYPSQLLQPTPKYDNGRFWSDGRDPIQKDMLELILRLCDREKIEVIPVIELSTPLVELESLRHLDPDSISGVDLVDYRGNRADLEIADRFAVYNPMDTRVHSAVQRVFEELMQRYGSHASLAGLGLKMSPETIVPLPGPSWGLDPTTVSRFAKDLEIKFASPNGDFTEIRRQVLSEYGQDWLEWRTGRINSLLERIAQTINNTGNNTGNNAGNNDRSLYILPTDLYQIEEARTKLSPSLRNSVDLPGTLQRIGLDFAAIDKMPDTVLLAAQRIAPDSKLVDNRTDIHVASDIETQKFLGAVADGKLFTWRHRWTHFSQLQAVNPFGTQAIDLYRIQPLSPSGFWIRRNLTKALGESDAQIIVEGGWLLPTGQQGSMAESIDVFRQLPRSKFVGVTPTDESKAHDLLTVRQLESQNQTYFYVVNPTPWVLQCELTANVTQATLTSLSDRDLNLIRKADRSAIQIELQPFEVIGGRTEEPGFAIVDYRVEMDQTLVDAMRQQLDVLLTKVSRVEQTEPRSVLSNTGFEGELENRSTGWQINSANQDSIQFQQIDDAREGQYCLNMKSAGANVFLRSNPVSLTETGRLSVVAWMRTIDENSPNVRISIDGEHRGRSYYRFGTVGKLLQASESDPNWKKFAVHFEDLPSTDLYNLTIGFDLMGEGQIQIDDVKVYDRWFDEQDTTALTQKFALAAYRLNSGKDLNGCREILEEYWAQFVNQYFADNSNDRQAMVPDEPAALPAEPNVNLLDQIKNAGDRIFKNRQP